MKVLGWFRVALPCLAAGALSAACQGLHGDESSNDTEMKAFDDAGTGANAATTDQAVPEAQTGASEEAGGEIRNEDGVFSNKDQNADPTMSADEAAPAKAAKAKGANAGEPAEGDMLSDVDAAPESSASMAPAPSVEGELAAVPPAPGMDALMAVPSPDGSSDSDKNDNPADEAQKKIALGQISDDEMRQVIYEGLKNRLGTTAALGGGTAETTEIGDFDSFKFVVVKLSKGRDDVSGDIGNEAPVPDGIDVEVTGWYKRQIASEGSQPACTSFDALVTLEKQGAEWRFKDDGGPAFGREDSEDCF